MGWPIEILDLECVLCHVIGVQAENKNALFIDINTSGLLARLRRALSKMAEV